MLTTLVRLSNGGGALWRSPPWTGEGGATMRYLLISLGFLLAGASQAYAGAGPAPSPEADLGLAGIVMVAGAASGAPPPPSLIKPGRPAWHDSGRASGSSGRVG